MTTLELTVAQKAFISAMTDQRCANFLETADFIADLSKEQKAFLSQANPETLEWLRQLRPEEIRGLQAYLALRSTSTYLMWIVAALVAGFTAVTVLYNNIKALLARP